MAIIVDNLSKRFQLGHQAGNRSYSTFRDVLAKPFKTLGRLKRKSSAVTDSAKDETFWALQDVSFHIHSGEKVGIIGRNGAGKSTLLKILSRIYEPSQGRIRIRGRLASLLEVGTGFHPELSGRENIYFNGAILGMGKAEIKRKLEEIVAFAEIEKFLDTPVKHYSSGMYVRLGFSVAAHLESEILILDEVLAVGDAQFQNKCLGRIQEIARQGRTVIFVSHNMSSILQFTDRTLLLEAGRIVHDGDSETGVSEYLKGNDQANRTGNLTSKVPWFKVSGFRYDQNAMEPGFNQTLKFTIQLHSERALDDATIILGISNTLGARLISGRTSLSSLPEGSSILDLQLPEHRLTPGTYFISLVIRAQGKALFAEEQVICIELVADKINDVNLLALANKGKDRQGCYCALEIKLHQDDTVAIQSTIPSTLSAA